LREAELMCVLNIVHDTLSEILRDIIL
jgi:hypothetical protein